MYKQRIEDSLNPSAKLQRTVDLRSDTMTVPTDAIRKAMFEAVVGDDVYGEDPTVNELEKTVAKLFEKESALFVPSGSMSNLLAIMVHCNVRGAEAYMGHNTHAFRFEQGNASSLANVFVNSLENADDGTFSIDAIRNGVHGADCHEPITQVVCIETSHNFSGGRVVPLAWIDELAEVCKEKKLALHIDGARIFNAAEYLKVPVSRIARDADSISFCLSKGLCCPVGSLLVGSKDFIATARRYRKALGGGLRQAGFLAAAGLCALETIVPSLGVDHKHTYQLAEAIHNLKSLTFHVDIERVETNMLMIKVFENPREITARDLCKRLVEIKESEFANGVHDGKMLPIIVKTCALSDGLLRLVFYHQITDELTQLGIKKIIYVMKELEGTL